MSVVYVKTYKNAEDHINNHGTLALYDSDFRPMVRVRETNKKELAAGEEWDIKFLVYTEQGRDQPRIVTTFNFVDMEGNLEESLLKYAPITQWSKE